MDGFDLGEPANPPADFRAASAKLHNPCTGKKESDGECATSARTAS